MADIDLRPISTLPVADMVFYVADTVCSRYRCNSKVFGVNFKFVILSVGLSTLFVWGDLFLLVTPCASETAAQCIVMPLSVCVFVCGSVTTITRNCKHRSSPNWVCR